MVAVAAVSIDQKEANILVRKWTRRKRIETKRTGLKTKARTKTKKRRRIRKKILRFESKPRGTRRKRKRRPKRKRGGRCERRNANPKDESEDARDDE
jgi:hypothetical protein